MARHIFNFDGGDKLTTMGAAWFVSYSFYSHNDTSHLNWENVSTCPLRISTFNRTTDYHKFWLGKISDMKDDNLNKNEIGLDASKIKEMAKALL